MIDKYLASQVLGLILAPVLCYYLARWKLRDELSAMKDKAPYEMLTNALKQREATIAQLVTAKNAEERSDDERDQKERVQLAETLVSISSAMRALKDEMVEGRTSIKLEISEHRKEERVRTGSLHNRLNEIQKDIWATRGGNGGQARA